MGKAAGGSERVRIAKGIHIYRSRESQAWQADLVFRRRRTRKSLGTADRATARTLALREAASFQAEADNLAAQGYTFVRALIDWTNYLPRSAREASMVALLRRLHSNMPADQVSEGSLMLALADLSPSYANRILNIARAALRLAAKHGHIKAPPIIGRKPSGPHRERFLSAEEWSALQDALPDHLRPVVAFSLETGLRKDNCLRLRWRNVNLANEMAWVEAIRAKARVPIPVPLSPAALKILRAQVGRHPDFVFTRQPFPKSRPNVYVPIGDPKKAWKSALERAGIRDFRWHDQRHTWASWHTMAGTSPKVLKDLGGWSSTAMVERYSHLNPDHLRQFAGAAGSTLAAAAKKSRRKKA